MSRGELSVQHACQAPSASMSNPFIEPALLPVCCVCTLIRDETGPYPVLERWVTQRIYRQTHGVNPANVPLTHTYCPTCFAQAQKTVREYLREARASV